MRGDSRKPFNVTLPFSIPKASWPPDWFNAKSATALCKPGIFAQAPCVTVGMTGEAVKPLTRPFAS